MKEKQLSLTDASATFEGSLKELEQVVHKLEEGNLPLEEAIRLYEQGVKLNQLCENKLKEAEQKVEQLKKLLTVQE